MEDQQLLILRWYTLLRGHSEIVTIIVAPEGSQYSDYGLMPLHSAVIIQYARPKSLTLCWCSYLEWGNKYVVFFFTYKDNKYFLFARIGQYNLLIAEGERLKIVDTPFTLTLKTY